MARATRQRWAWAWIALGLAGAQAAGAREAGPAGYGANDRLAERRTDERLRRIADDPARLRLFVHAMPKGGDLHNHLSGAVYAEDYLRWADRDGLCVDTQALRLSPPPCQPPAQVPARGLDARDPGLHARLVDALSMRDHDTPSIDGPQPARFFATFGRFGAAFAGNAGHALAAVREGAAAESVSYLELMYAPRAGAAVLDPAGADELDGSDLPALAARLAPLLPEAVAQARAQLDRDEALARAESGCAAAAPPPACAVEVRYQAPAARHYVPARVFASMAYAFALAEADPRVVAVNLVGPEHHPLARRDYRLHMRMLAFLRARHPSVPLSLHAGELRLGLVPPRDLRHHIGDAIEIAGARRIGHGAALAHEADAAGLLRRMAGEGIAVEINLGSNAAILGLRGREHPLSLYRQAGVPVVLSTDDAGVLRSDLSDEFRRAVQEQGWGYLDLKRAARDSLEHAFLPGASLWRDAVGGTPVAACAGQAVADEASGGCRDWLQRHAKARLQWRLERDLAAFEAAQARDDAASETTGLGAATEPD